MPEETQQAPSRARQGRRKPANLQSVAETTLVEDANWWSGWDGQFS
jgi:hypothetical protein